MPLFLIIFLYIIPRSPMFLIQSLLQANQLPVLRNTFQYLLILPSLYFHTATLSYISLCTAFFWMSLLLPTSLLYTTSLLYNYFLPFFIKSPVLAAAPDILVPTDILTAFHFPCIFHVVSLYIYFFYTLLFKHSFPQYIINLKCFLRTPL